MFLFMEQKTSREKVQEKENLDPSTKIEKGAFPSLVNELQDDDVKFFNFYRMSKSSSNELLYASNLCYKDAAPTSGNLLRLLNN